MPLLHGWSPLLTLGLPPLSCTHYPTSLPPHPPPPLVAVLWGPCNSSTQGSLLPRLQAQSWPACPQQQQGHWFTLLAHRDPSPPTGTVWTSNKSQRTGNPHFAPSACRTSRWTMVGYLLIIFISVAFCCCTETMRTVRSTCLLVYYWSMHEKWQIAQNLCEMSF